MTCSGEMVFFVLSSQTVFAWVEINLTHSAKTSMAVSCTPGSVAEVAGGKEGQLTDAALYYDLFRFL